MCCVLRSGLGAVVLAPGMLAEAGGEGYAMAFQVEGGCVTVWGRGCCECMPRVLCWSHELLLVS